MSSAGTFCSLQYSAQTSPNGIVFNSSARIINLFLKEKLSWKHYAMILLVVIGIAVMGVFDI